MPTRNVVLTERHEKIIETFVASGRYQNASEVLREGLRLLEQREAENEAKLAALRAAATVGFAELDAGQYVELREHDVVGYIAKLGRQAAKIAANAER
ncbi:MAG: type II toxin-antitoxin system ParD family antitoxin [Rhodomicrobium sp.]